MALLGAGAVLLFVFDMFVPALVLFVLSLLFGVALRSEAIKIRLVSRLTGIPADVLQAARAQGDAAPRPTVVTTANLPADPWAGMGVTTPATANPAPARAPQSEDELNAIVERERQEALLLKRHWPPTEPCDANSWLGGTPRLPEGLEWPVNPKTGLALHHLAQIDLAEMPQLQGGPLPKTGMMWFFADIDQDMCWAPEPENGQTRVLYHPESTRDRPLHDVPETLPEVDHFGPNMTSEFWGFRGTRVRVYPRWPVTGHISGVWAFSDEAPESVTEAYAYFDAKEARLAQEREAVLGPKTSDTPLQMPVIDTLREEAIDKKGRTFTKVTFAYVATGAGGYFPFTTRLGQMVLEQMMHKVKADLPSYEKKLERAHAESRPVPEVTQSIFDEITRAKDAVEALQTNLADAAMDAPFPASEQPSFDALMSDLAERKLGSVDWKNTVGAVCRGVVAQAMEQPEVLAQVPEGIIRSTERTSLPSHARTHHYLGGLKGAASNPTPGHGIRLAQFDSDDALGMMFCDVGIIDFWIDPEDLATGRWDRAWGATAGG